MRITLVILFLFFLSATSASAQVKINEFSSNTPNDWVEIYSDQDIDISGWIIRDSASTIVKTIESGSSIGPSSNKYLQVSVSNRLNKDGDTIKLLKPDDITIEDQVSYGSEGELCTPSDTGSLGRQPDGTGSFTRFLVSSPGASNNNQIDPCPTPTPSPQPSPKISPSPSPNKSLIPISSLTPGNLKIATNNSESNKSISPDNLPAPSEKNTLGLSDDKDIDLTSYKINPPSPSPSPIVVKNDNNFTKIAGFSILGSGILFLLAAVFYYYKNNKSTS